MNVLFDIDLLLAFSLAEYAQYRFPLFLDVSITTDAQHADHLVLRFLVQGQSGLTSLLLLRILLSRLLHRLSCFLEHGYKAIFIQFRFWYAFIIGLWCFQIEELTKDILLVLGQLILKIRENVKEKLQLLLSCGVLYDLAD